MKHIETDVLVIGSGIAGISSAISAAQEGVSVTLATSIHLFSGSTFYPGTWGLGLIGPENEKDIPNLIEAISSIGKQMALPHLVETFVKNLNETIDGFEELGIDLERPSKGSESEKEYIPCFDTKHRRWRGLTKDNLRNNLPQILEDLNINVIENFEAIQLIKTDDYVMGAVGVKDKQELLAIKAKATILATGGLSGLYKRYLTTSDVTGTGLAMALQAGAKGINLEFTQMMLGFIKPGAKTIHNEKTFYACEFYNEKNETFHHKVLPENMTMDEVLLARSLHGPFSSETISKYVDLGIYQEIQNQNEKSITMRYNPARLNLEADFVKTYFNWLRDEKNIEIDDDIQIAPYMHASNGGILINEKAETGVKGLYAAGEVTGGMHGADRIGGLSTANGLVFGKIAGKNAADYLKSSDINIDKEFEFKPLYIKDVKDKILAYRNILDENAFLIREENKLDFALDKLPELLSEQKEDGSINDLKHSYHLYNGVISAMALVTMQKIRKESRGSHYREDYPQGSDEYNSPHKVMLQQNEEVLSKEEFIVEK